MADRLTLHATGSTNAAPSELWPLIVDVGRYPEWGMWQETGYEHPGDTSPHGVGAVRWLRYGRTRTVERIVELVDGERVSYRVLSGIPVKDYVATVELAPEGRGTRVTWTATYAPTLLGRLIHRKMTAVYERCVRDLCAAGDRMAADSGSTGSRT
jgi:hypothetical protein